MRDLSTALRDHVDGLAPPVRYDEVVTRRPQRSRPPFLLTAAAVVVMLAVAAVAVRSREDGLTSPAALRDEGTGTRLIWGDRGLVLADPDTGTQRELGGPDLRCGTCPILRVGRSLYLGGHDGIYRLDPPNFGATRIADGNIVFRTSRPDELYVATADRDALRGTDLRRITTTGEVRGGPWPVPDGFSLTDPPQVTARGVLLESYPTLAVWDPATGATRTIPAGGGPIDTFVRDGATIVASVFGKCEESPCPLFLTDVTGRTRAIEPPDDDVGFVLGGGRFSPDGSKLAAFSVLNRGFVGGEGGGRRMRLVIVDVATGTVSPIRKSTGEFGEDYGFATWSPDGQWVFFGPLESGAMGAHRLGTRDAVGLDLPANYSAVAVRSPEPGAT